MVAKRSYWQMPDRNSWLTMNVMSGNTPRATQHTERRTLDIRDIPRLRNTRLLNKKFKTSRRTKTLKLKRLTLNYKLYYSTDFWQHWAVADPRVGLAGPGPHNHNFEKKIWKFPFNCIHVIINVYANLPRANTITTEANLPSENICLDS